MSGQAGSARPGKFIGLMSGTSMDGIDAALVSFPTGRVEIHATHSMPYPDDLRHRVCRLSQNQGTPDDIGEVDHAIGELFALTACGLLEKSQTTAAEVAAIGSHGQTIRHQPRHIAPFSMQIGDPNLIVEKTGITTITDFRRRDMAAGGEGAPLVPAFHRAFFGSSEEDRCILNLGGIANISWLPAGSPESASGFDTGPANALLDAWSLDQTGRPFDEDGHWASEGKVNRELLDDMLTDAYFAQHPPKSTGKEKFNLSWIRTVVQRHPDIPPADIQRTLLALTVQTIVDQLPENTAVTIYACGGGVRNSLLFDELAHAIQPRTLRSTAELGLDPQWVEASAFAWLAKQTLEGKTGNLPGATGARGSRILGAIYLP